MENIAGAGYVYILTNPSFVRIGKIRKCSKPVDIRSKELDNTAVPLPFRIFATKTVKYNGVEKLIILTIGELPYYSTNRGFFNVLTKRHLKFSKKSTNHKERCCVIIEYENNELCTVDSISLICSKPSCKENVLTKWRLHQILT